MDLVLSVCHVEIHCQCLGVLEICLVDACRCLFLSPSRPPAAGRAQLIQMGQNVRPMRLGSWLLAGRITGLATLLISIRRTRDSKNLKSSLGELKDMSSGQIVGVLRRPITELEQLPALANRSRGLQNVGHLHMPIRVKDVPRRDPCRFTQRSSSSLSLAPPVPSKLDDASQKGPTDGAVSAHVEPLVDLRLLSLRPSDSVADLHSLAHTGPEHPRRRWPPATRVFACWDRPMGDTCSG